MNASRKRATVGSQSRYFDQGFTASVFRMEMRRLVIVMVEIDRNAVKLADAGHFCYTLTFGAASPVSGR